MKVERKVRPGRPREAIIQEATENIARVYRDVNRDKDLRAAIKVIDEKLQAEDTLAAFATRTLAAAAGSRRCVTEKSVSNFMYLGLVERLLPAARVVACVRDPLDTCLSCYTRLFRNGQAFSYDLTELGRYYRLYDELMAYWRAVLPGRLLEIDYEVLVADPEPQVEALLAHCGLDWDTHCLAPHENQRAVRTASVTQVRRPLYGSSVARWRRFEAHLGPLIEALGPLADQAARES